MRRKFFKKAFKESLLFGLLGLWAMMNLAGCGTKAQANPAVAGVFVDSMTVSYLRTGFDQAKSCTQLSKGSYDELSVIVMPPVFSCPYYTNGCNGEYSTPNMIKVGDYGAWKHEVIHYLLFMNTGDPDSNHASPFFTSCV